MWKREEGSAVFGGGGLGSSCRIVRRAGESWSAICEGEIPEEMISSKLKGALKAR